MKTFLKVLAIGLLGCFGPGAFNTRADLEVGATVQINARADFYAPLTPQGSWVEVSSYGRCWRPAGIAVEWRPYCEGYWVWTDCGWYWHSDEPWAWACYHYGYWAHDSGYGWVWVPDVVWGPAWVSWRVGGGYVGWAPLPPPGFSVHVAAPSLFVFVETGRFTEPVRSRTVIVNNTTIIERTKVINNMKRADRAVDGSASRRVMINEGPGIEPIQKATGKKIDAVRIGDVARRTPVPEAVKQKQLEPSGRKTSPAVQQPAVREQQKPASKPERPAAVPEFQPRSVPPGQGGPPRGNEIVPRSVQPPLAPPARPVEPPGQGKGPEHDKDKGHEKDKGRP